MVHFIKVSVCECGHRVRVSVWLAGFQEDGGGNFLYFLFRYADFI